MTKKYGEGVVKVTDNTFRKWTNELSEFVTHRDGVDNKVWIVIAIFCAMRNINNAKNWLGGTTQKTERLTEPREINLQFLQC